MSALLKSIEEQASALSAEDRARLAESMLESLQPSIADIEAAWAKEIEERVSAFERGELSLSSADDVFAEARQTLRRSTHALLILQGASCLPKFHTTKPKSQDLADAFLLPYKKQRLVPLPILSQALCACGSPR